MINKRKLSLLLAVILLLPLFAIPAQAATEIATPVAFFPEPSEITYTGRNIVTFVINTAADKFLRLVDSGGIMPKSAYEVSNTDDGKARITLSASYLNKLKKGTYNIAAVFSTGSGSIKLIVPFGALDDSDNAFAPSEGKVTKQVSLMSIADYKKITTVPRNASVTVTGFMDDDAIIEYDGNVGTVPAKYLNVDFAKAVSGETTGTVTVYKTMKATRKNILVRLKREGMALTIYGRYGDWYKASYKSYDFYMQAKYAKLNI